MKNPQSRLHDNSAEPGPDPLMIEDEEFGGHRGFAVVVERVVGEVIYGSGEKTPHHAALDIIGSINEEGRFSFPHEDGGRTVVEVTFPLRDRR